MGRMTQNKDYKKSWNDDDEILYSHVDLSYQSIGGNCLESVIKVPWNSL